MELLIFKLKSGIKIKPSHKGLFTSYCNGKVTNECIQKGKNSPNPVIRKRATFAANVRKWKHEFGGKFNGFVKGINVLDSDKDAYKYVKKKYKMRSALNGDNTNNWLQKAGKWLNSDQGKAFSGLATDLISYGVNLKNINKAYKQLKEALQKLYDYIASNIDESQLKNQALENLTNLPEGQHVGMVDLLTEQEKLRREALKKQKTLADNWLTNQELNLNNWMQSVQGGASDNLQSSITNFINTYGNKDKV